MAVHANILAERQALALEAIQDQMARWAIGEYTATDEDSEREIDPSLMSDFSELESGAKLDPAYPAFVDAMRGRRYGGKALTDAWSWFRHGFNKALLRRA